MRAELGQLYHAIKRAFEDVVPLISTAQAVVSSDADLEHLVDAAFACREAIKFLERMRIDISRMGEQAEQMACLLYISVPEHLASGSKNIRTSYCTATPDVKMAARVPTRRKNPDGYAAMMTALGVPRELWDVREEDHEAMRVHWPGMIDYLSGLAAEGKPLPAGIDPTQVYPVYKLLMRARGGGIEQQQDEEVVF